MMRLIFISALSVLGACSPENQDGQRHPLDRLKQDPGCSKPVDLYGHEPDGGVVSSAGIAKNVAYQYLRAVYPEDQHLRPLQASLRGGVWTVNGTLPEGSIGGVAGIRLCQSNGRVLQITHGK
ncbi:MAG: hypothetical protein EPO38_08880 [Rhizorhabdus sp.]|nr:MAG: hypothetical protein EPO38_08880 [Rhizorhabdus sp.]